MGRTKEVMGIDEHAHAIMLFNDKKINNVILNTYINKLIK